LAALQQQQLLRSNPLLSNMLNPSLLAQFQMQQQMQLQQLQRILEAQKMFQKPQTNMPQNRAPHPRVAPKNARNPKARKPNRAVQNQTAVEEVEKPLPHRRILAINLPQNIQTIETVTGVFHPYGDVTVVRVVKPGKNLPQDIKPWLRKIPDLGRTCCAIVDFETARAAKFAVHVLRQREHEVGFRCGLLKPGIEEKLYEQKTAETALPAKALNTASEHPSDSGITSEDQNSSASTRSTSASEQSDHSDSEIISSHTESDQEQNRSKPERAGTVKYDRDFLLSFSFKNKRMPSGLANLEHILTKQNVDDRENCASEPIRQPRGPLGSTSGFRLARR
jgi:hypothetical protein